MRNIKLDTINQEFDDLKMQGSYDALIKLVIENKGFLESRRWKVDKIIKDCNRIIKLHKGL